MGALLSILTQVHITAYAKAHWRPLQAITLGLTCMAAAFVPMLVAGPFLPLDAAPIATSAVETAHVFDQGPQSQPGRAECRPPCVGTMTSQPLCPQPIPVLGGNRLGTYFGFYYMVQGIGVIVGNLAMVGIDLSVNPGV